jgi:hypothetical protein
MPPLCAPAEELSCFGCCPPIRPHHYDPLDFVTILRREFAENRRAFLHSPLQVKPIIGYHCWALGYLDSRGRTVGCLLHPSRNQGRDLRDLIDYGNKCRRESCRAARVFDELPLDGQSFWLSLVKGMNAFFYSSPRANPLFHVLLWGARLLETLRRDADKRGWSASELVYVYRFLMDKRWKPQGHRYLFHLMLDRLGTRDGLPAFLEEASSRLLTRILALKEVENLSATYPEGEGILTHRANERPDFLDFVRLGLGIARVSEGQLRNAKEAIEAMPAEIVDAHDLCHALSVLKDMPSCC